jgi:hypothetical protein
MTVRGITFNILPLSIMIVSNATLSIMSLSIIMITK